MISSSIGLIVVAAFLGVIFYNGGLREYEEPEVNEAAATQKFNAAANGSAVGKVKYTYPEINQMLKTQVVTPMSEKDSFAKVTALELAFDEEKNQPVAYVWISIKDKVPVLYTVHGEFFYNAPAPDAEEVQEEPIGIKVKRLDIGRLPIFVSTHTFLNGFKSLLNNGAMQSFFQRASEVEFTSEGMSVNFKKGGPTGTALTPAASAATPKSASNLSSSSAKSSAASEKAEAARQKAEEEKEKKKQIEEERKRKAEEYRQQQKEKEEERKRKAEEEKERRKQEEEERKRQIEEENQRRREEAEQRRRDRENNRYNNNNGYNSSSRSSRSSRSSSSRNNRY